MSEGVEGKKRVGRPRTGKRPVIAIRVHDDLYKKIRQSAAAGKLSISEEAENRIKQSLEWDGVHGDPRKKRKAVLAQGVEPDLSQLGYQRIALSQGSVWAARGMKVSRMSVEAALVIQLIRPELTHVVKRILLRIEKQGSQP